MNSKQLNTFFTIAEEGSFSRASSRLFLSVPALKRQMDTLEAELKVTLFSRNNHGLTLTEAGLSFYNYLKQALPAFEEELNNLRAISCRTDMTIKVCYNTDHICDNIYLNALTSYKKLHPKQEVLLVKVDDFDMNNFDLFLGILKSKSKLIKKYMLCKMPLNCIFPRTSPLSRKESITINDLKEVGLLLLPPAELLSQVPNLTDCLKITLNAPNHSYQSVTNKTSYQFEAINSCKCSIIIGSENNLPPSLCQIPLDGFTFPYYIYSINIEQKPEIQEYINYLQSYYRQHCHNQEAKNQKT